LKVSIALEDTASAAQFIYSSFGWLVVSKQVGICGEHGGEPSSVAFFAKAGLDYVSCSPFRLAEMIEPLKISTSLTLYISVNILTWNFLAGSRSLG
jgi:pyruvate,orthophosphate dikinase